MRKTYTLRIAVCVLSAVSVATMGCSSQLGPRPASAPTQQERWWPADGDKASAAAYCEDLSKTAARKTYYQNGAGWALFGGAASLLAAGAILDKTVDEKEKGWHATIAVGQLVGAAVGVLGAYAWKRAAASDQAQFHAETALARAGVKTNPKLTPAVPRDKEEAIMLMDECSTAQREWLGSKSDRAVLPLAAARRLDGRERRSMTPRSALIATVSPGSSPRAPCVPRFLP